jgi:tetratricopeptide (TPR) repeat protein
LAERALAGGPFDNAKAAVQLLQQLENKPSGDVEGLYLLGRACQILNQPRRAAKTWETVVALQPRHEGALDALAVHAHESRDLVGARRYYERLIEINPGKARYYGRLAHVLGQEGNLLQAIEVAEKCLELDPSLSQSHAWLIEACRNSGDEQRAAYHETKWRQFQSLQKQKR